MGASVTGHFIGGTVVIGPATALPAPAAVPWFLVTGAALELERDASCDARRPDTGGEGPAPSITTRESGPASRPTRRPESQRPISLLMTPDTPKTSGHV